ncbi:MAG: hypothetical protein KME20_11785 [Kaiparowitsia implicata GSE-PSE-MK54-09C]|jgi:hypothetical protein|nr:hypothetical protein [Kaiparowitsia implicata GSE-PSE-MK54-09C]
MLELEVIAVVATYWKREFKGVVLALYYGAETTPNRSVCAARRTDSFQGKKSMKES